MSNAELLAVPGMLASKADKYGVEILSLVSRFSAALNLPLPVTSSAVRCAVLYDVTSFMHIQAPIAQQSAIGSPRSIPAHLKPPTPEIDESKSHMRTAIMLNEGKTVAEIRTLRSLAEGTIYNHLAKAMDDGYEVDISKLHIPEAHFNEIREMSEELGSLTSLRTIKEKVDPEIPYPTITIVLAHQRFYRKRASTIPSSMHVAALASPPRAMPVFKPASTLTSPAAMQAAPVPQPSAQRPDQPIRRTSVVLFDDEDITAERIKRLREG